MKRFFLFVVLGLILSFFNVYLQAENTDDCIREGYIITKKNEKVEGMVWLCMEKIFLNRKYQKQVYFLPTEKFEALKKLKKKNFTKYTPEKIKGYGFDDFKFLSVKYADMSAAGLAILGKMYFLQVVEEGKINVFRYYVNDPENDNTKQTVQYYEKVTEEVKKTSLGYLYEILVQKDGGKVRNNERVKMEDLIGDCKLVYDKYLAGGYGFIPKNDDTKKGLRKLISKVRDKEGLLEALPKIAQEYNAHMEGK